MMDQETVANFPEFELTESEQALHTKFIEADDDEKVKLFPDLNNINKAKVAAMSP